MNRRKCLPLSGRGSVYVPLLLIIISLLGSTDQSLAQDPTDNLSELFVLPYYLTGTVVYTPANGDAPLRLRMAMFIGRNGGVDARTERRAAGQLPLRYWSGYARPQPETGAVAGLFYDASGEMLAPLKPNGSFKALPLPDGLVATGSLQPINGVGDVSPNLSLGPLSFRLANRRATGGGIDPDGSTYAFSLSEQKVIPYPDPGTFVPVPYVALADESPIEGTLVVTHPNGQVDRLPASGFIDSEIIFVFVPGLSGQQVDFADFKGPIRYTRVGADAGGVLHVAPSNKALLPGVNGIGVTIRNGMITGGCVADDGTAYAFVLKGKPAQVSTIGKGF